ncbi:unnamed protein product, partial [Laminaria digitata]
AGGGDGGGGDAMDKNGSKAAPLVVGWGTGDIPAPAGSSLPQRPPGTGPRPLPPQQQHQQRLQGMRNPTLANGAGQAPRPTQGNPPMGITGTPQSMFAGAPRGPGVGSWQGGVGVPPRPFLPTPPPPVGHFLPGDP